MEIRWDAGLPLDLAKEGKGRLYYRIGLKYAPADLKLPAADYGFTVQRNYEAVKDNRDVSRDADGYGMSKLARRSRSPSPCALPRGVTMWLWWMRYRLVLRPSIRPSWEWDRARPETEGGVPWGGGEMGLVELLLV